jgi:putative FmdB family regulatory protein
VPLYEFDCCTCGARFEEVVPAGCVAPCPACGGERVNRVFSQIAARGVPVGLSGAAARDSDRRRSEREAAKKERFVAERKQTQRGGERPPGI